MKNIRDIIAIALLVIAFFDLNPQKIWDNIPIIKPTPVLVIDRPSDELIALTKPVSDVIIDKQDKKYMAVFTNEFASRKYTDVNMQNINDIFTLAAKDYFGESSLAGKYKGLPEKLQELMSVMEVESADTKLTDEQLKKLSDRFKALSWNLVQ